MNHNQPDESDPQDANGVPSSLDIRTSHAWEAGTGPGRRRRMVAMKRDRTVTVSVVGLVATLVLASVLKIPKAVEPDDPAHYWVILGVMLLCALRLSLLWLQTLIHAVENLPRSDRAAWVLGHLFFGPLSSLWYYLKTRPVPDADDAEEGA
jgi:hypothetical protein